ncbi:MAG TPA: bifunctional UDP-sugar hydrolase/5'-nucleotidase [Beijerinckiaceae bacterium]|jgi:2',3'-cyclic-nucleotide 2'-phosphodiesterase (5'-nucleotidase family)
MSLLKPPRLIAAALAVVAGAGLAFAQEAKVTFVLTNDVYQMSEEKGRGGLARLAAVVKAEKAKGGTVLFVHAGDTWSPCLLCGFDKGEHMVALFNEIPPDVFVPGNHEFDFGKEVYAERRAQAKFPFFAANLRGPDGKLLPGHQDRTVVDVNGVKVGIVGLALETTPNLSNPGDLTFAPAVETLKREAKALRDEGADLVVAVTHTDFSTDMQIVNQRLADVLLTGHDHDLRVYYDGRTVMAESGEDAHYVVAIDLDVAVATEDGRRRARWTPRFRIVATADAAPDPAVAAKVKAYESELSKELDVPLAPAMVELDTRNAAIRHQENGFGNLVADAVRVSAEADVAMVNGGGFRGNRVYPEGTTLTRRDVLSEMPFGNTTVMIEISGAGIRAALENGFSEVERPSGRFPQISGMSVVVDGTRPKGARVVSVKVQGQPLDDARTYRLATNNFMLRGGDGYGVFTAQKRLIGETDGKLMAGEVMAHMRRLGTVAAKPEGRIVIR